MALLHEGNLESESEDDDVERCHGLLVRRTISYLNPAGNSKTKFPLRRSIETIGVDQAVACALKSHPKIFHYTQKRLREIPSSIEHLAMCETIRELDLHGNRLRSLPDEIGRLKAIEICNLGNNSFEDLPLILGSLPRLTKLFLFNNHLGNLSSSLGFSQLTYLRILNLNHNSITHLPADIGQLINLEILTIEHNQLSELPCEIGLCTRLIELHLGYNRLTKLPLEIGYLIELKQLVVHRNQLLELPESVSHLKSSLRILDVAGNGLRIFPSKFNTLLLTEFYAEHNPLLERAPIHSVQEHEILTLKELCARTAMAELRNPSIDMQPSLRERVQNFQRAKEILMLCTECQFCHNYFLNTWLECVQFVDVQRTFKGTINPTTPIIPQRVLLCSYECFNSPGHDYFGVAFS